LAHGKLLPLSLTIGPKHLRMILPIEKPVAELPWLFLDDAARRPDCDDAVPPSVPQVLDLLAVLALHRMAETTNGEHAEDALDVLETA
jgi:hypothetical protein